MCGGMCELVLLIIAMCEVDEDSEVVLSRGDFDTRTSKLGRQLIKPTCSNALFRAVDEERRDRGMMRRLLCEV